MKEQVVAEASGELISATSVEQAQLKISPAAGVALTLLQDRINRLFFSIVKETETQGRTAENRQINGFAARLELACSYFDEPIKGIVKWLFTSKETTNFTYDLTDSNKSYLAALVSVVTGVSITAARGYLTEIEYDHELKAHVSNLIAKGSFSNEADLTVHFCRRIGWYALARAKKPKIIIETGVDKGLGSCVLTAALARNAQEGAAGYYYGTDINPSAGYLFRDPYTQFGKILYGDSIGTLCALPEKIDMFINDSDHSAGYEQSEYETVSCKLNHDAIVLGDNAHVTTKLFEYAQQSGRKYLFFQENPKDHWYPGAGIGIAFR